MNHAGLEVMGINKRGIIFLDYYLGLPIKNVSSSTSHKKKSEFVKLQNYGILDFYIVTYSFINRFL